MEVGLQVVTIVWNKLDLDKSVKYNGGATQIRTENETLQGSSDPVSP